MAGCVHTGWRDTQFPADCAAAVVELAGTAIPGLRQFRPSPHTPRAGYGNQGTDQYPIPVYWVKLPQRSGLIDFGGDDWVYIAIVSVWHDDEDSGRPDITMAVDSDGGLWLNREHVCGWVCFSASDRGPAASHRDFLRNFYGGLCGRNGGGKNGGAAWERIGADSRVWWLPTTGWCGTQIGPHEGGSASAAHP